MDKAILNDIKEVAALLQDKGWAERNAGNYSYRIKNSLIVSTSGARFRDIAKDPEKLVCTLPLDADKPAKTPPNPTSELQMHLLVQRFLAKNTPEKLAVLHAHPTNLIAYSHKNFKRGKQIINQTLLSTIPEVKLYIPSGLGLVDIFAPGSEALAEATMRECMAHEIVLWNRHGCVAVGESLTAAFDLMDIMDKAAYIAYLAGL